jgi:ABC-type transport system substrate-binding protein
MNEPTLDQLIETAALDLEREEAEAVMIEKRLALASIPHSSQWMSLPRSRGTMRNPYQKGSKFDNLTVRVGLEARDSQLASYLARKANAELPAPDYKAQEAQASREAAAERMIAETKALAERNAAVRAAHDHARFQNLPNKPGSQGGFYL